MSDDLHTSTTAAPSPAGGSSARQSVSDAVASANTVAAQKPEVLAGAAFAGGFLAAMILKRLGR